MKNERNKDNQEILKWKFQQGVKEGRPESADDLVEGLDTKIKVNLK